jgi:hypothetical protein
MTIRIVRKDAQGSVVNLSDLVPKFAGRPPVFFDNKHVNQRAKYRRRI